MADIAHSTPVPEIHELTGSSPPGAGAPQFKPATAPKPRPQTRPRLDARTPEYVKRLVPLIRRENDVTRRFSMLYRHEILSEHATYLEKLGRRLTRRVSRWTRRLMADKATDSRELGLKADVAIELITAGWSDGGVGDEMMLSVCHDAVALGMDAVCLPEIPGGNFGAYHRAVLEAHAAMEALPPEATDADAAVFMDRWSEIDRMAMADRPKTLADAIGALHYALREHRQFHIGDDYTDGDPCPGDLLIEHLLDSAVTVLQRVVQEDAASLDLARQTGIATISQMADLDFEPWDMEGWVPPTNVEWAKLADPYLITSRMAYAIVHKTKPQLVEMVRGIEETSGEEMLTGLLERLNDVTAWFGVFRDMAKAAEARLLSAGSTAAREDGEPQAQPGFDLPEPTIAPDRRAVAAYREWLHMEQRLLGMEMYPQMGADSERFTPVGTAGHNYHFQTGAMASWRDLPQPSTRAEAMCRVLGIDWTTDEQRDERFMPIAPAADATRAA